MIAIRGFFGGHRFLSNFYPVNISYEGIKYPSVEHAYQASKTDNRALKIKISKLPVAADAKREGKHLNLTPEWHEKKLLVMYLLSSIKYTNPLLKLRLLKTGDSLLEETNNWGDTFWGVCNGTGENNLGKILMRIRREITEGV